MGRLSWGSVVGSALWPQALQTHSETAKADWGSAGWGKSCLSQQNKQCCYKIYIFISISEEVLHIRALCAVTLVSIEHF